MGLISKINTFLWSCPLLFVLMGTHLYFTMKLRFPQIHIIKAVKLSVTPEKQSASGKNTPVSPFAAPIAIARAR